MQSLYEIENTVDIKTPILLHNLEGNLGAGRSGYMVSRHLFNTLKSIRIATFNVDELIDIKTYRPLAVFESWKLTDIEFVKITLDLFYDDKGVAFLMLSGPEPARYWNKFAKAVIEIAKSFGVEKAYSLTGIAANIPHTRKAGVDVAVTNEKYDKEKTQNDDRIRVLSTVDVFLQFEMAKEGIDGFGLVTPVPFYLAESDFPQGAYQLLEKFSSMTGLVLPLGDLAVACELANGMLNNNQEIAENEGLIRALEEQFDKGRSLKPNIGFSNKQTKAVESFPSGEELAESIELFLKTQDNVENTKSVERKNNSSFFKRFFNKK